MPSCKRSIIQDPVSTRIVANALLPATRLLVGRILETCLALGTPCNCVVREATQTVCSLTSHALAKSLLASC